MTPLSGSVIVNVAAVEADLFFGPTMSGEGGGIASTSTTAKQPRSRSPPRTRTPPAALPGPTGG
jgi:hypothetical protein